MGILKNPLFTSFNPQFGAVIAAGGRGKRFETSKIKLLQKADGVPVIVRTLKTFLQLIAAENLVLVLPEDQKEEFRKVINEKCPESQDITFATGGERRQDSVVNGLQALPENVQIVAVQDGGRPYTSNELVKACFVSTLQNGSGVAARRLIDTIKIAEANGKVKHTLNRELVWAAETPQVFKRSEIEHAYREIGKKYITVTDEAQALEAAGYPVFLVAHQESNPKITFTEDLTNRKSKI